MENFLQNRRILITRTGSRAQTLVDAIVSVGGSPILVPTVEILSLEYSDAITSLFKQLHTFDIAIFLSPNAVIKIPIANHLRVIAIGPGTQARLNGYSIKADELPAHFSSEGLLELPFLQDVVAKRVVIFCAEGGRMTLSETLRQRGAQVTLAHVYCRRCPDLNLQEQSSDWQKYGIDLGVATSGASLHNLLHMVGESAANWLKQLPWLVVSQRIADMAGTLGFVISPAIADNATNEAIFKALEEMSKRGFGLRHF